MPNVVLDSKSTIYRIPRREWPKLRDLYRRNWPKHILSYYTLKIHIEWIEANPRLEITIYTSDEDWRHHGTYVLVDLNGARCNILFNTLHPLRTADQLLNALKCLHKDAVFTLAAFVQQVRPVTEQFLYHLGQDDFENCACDTILYYLPMTCALQLATEPKAGYHLRPLSLDDVPLIDSLWPHRYPGSDEFIRNVVRHNFTLGAYEERGGRLCGWVMQEQVGTIGLLQVLDSYKRAGLGEQLVRQMAVLMAHVGMDATATVMCNNRPSRNLFQKLGFKIIDRVYWYDKKPKSQPETSEGLNDADFSQLLHDVENCA